MMHFLYKKEVYLFITNEFNCYFCRYITIILKQSSSSDTLDGIAVLRTFRVFRALKTVSIVPGRLIFHDDDPLFKCYNRCVDPVKFDHKGQLWKCP